MSFALEHSRQTYDPQHQQSIQSHDCHALSGNPCYEHNVHSPRATGEATLMPSRESRSFTACAAASINSTPETIANETQSKGPYSSPPGGGVGVAAAEPAPAERFFVVGPPAAPEARRLRAGAAPVSLAARDAALLRPGPPVFLRSSRSAASFSSFSFSTKRISVSHRRASSWRT